MSEDQRYSMDGGQRLDDYLRDHPDVLGRELADVEWGSMNEQFIENMQTIIREYRKALQELRDEPV